MFQHKIKSAKELKYGEHVTIGRDVITNIDKNQIIIGKGTKGIICGITQNGFNIEIKITETIKMVACNILSYELEGIT